MADITVAYPQFNALAVSVQAVYWCMLGRITWRLSRVYVSGWQGLSQEVRETAETTAGVCKFDGL